ncbi:5754_t:CDS:2 [Ambispora leptoticha]|uniref:5754_t:CDS:1 n=1 Tax=Ambispora leptoticha TaxID=144679 RepID=A0A9N9AM09_9GLOM|nr:5754_t:CDS:2 [Ambispora leptoticha]
MFECAIFRVIEFSWQSGTSRSLAGHVGKIKGFWAQFKDAVTYNGGDLRKIIDIDSKKVLGKYSGVPYFTNGQRR